MCSGPGGCNHGATRAGQSRGREGPAGGNPPAPPPSPPPPPNFPPPFPSGAGRAGVAPPDLHRGGLVLRPPGHPRAGVSSAGAVWPRPALRMRARSRGGASGCCGGRGGAGGRRARARAGRLRAAGGVGRGRCARPLAVGRREGGSRWCAAWPSLAVCAPPRPQERGWSNQAAWGRCLGFGDAIGVRGAASTSHPYDGARPGAKLPGNPRSRRHCECALTTTPRAVFGHGHEGCACGGEAATCSGAARPGGQRARARGTPCVLCA